MGWGKGKTEKGQGGKLGHSNRDGWGFHNEEKESSKKQRRLDQKQLILDETSKIDQNLIEYTNELLQTLNDQNLKFEFNEFDSGAVMIDFWIRTETYCVQMVDDKFGWTRIDENTGLCTIPDSSYMDWNEFKFQFERIIKHTPNEM